MSERKLTSSEQITNLNAELIHARAQAYEARAALDSVEDRIKAIKNALQGAALGQQFEKDRTVEAQRDPAE